MTEWSRADALDRVRELVETVESDLMPVPVREVWVYGDLALGLDPVQRLDVYLTKDILLQDSPDREEAFRDRHGIEGVGRTVRASWAEEYPEHLRASTNGYAAPEDCLAAHLVGEAEPIHLEVCNASFEDNVTQRLEGAVARESYGEILDPRGACLWIDGQWAEDTVEKLRDGELVFPTLPDALEMLGLDPDQAREAARAVEQFRQTRDGVSVRGDVL